MKIEGVERRGIEKHQMRIFLKTRTVFGKEIKQSNLG